MKLQEDDEENQQTQINNNNIINNKDKNKFKFRYKFRIKKTEIIKKIIFDSDEEEIKEENGKKKDVSENPNNQKNNEIKNKIIPITKYSSLDPNLFYDEFIIDYKCFLCGLIPSFETAEEVICCGYLLCEQCKKKFEEKKKICPICEIPLSKIKFRKIKKFNKIFYKSLKHFLIKCPYKCTWIGFWNDLESHLLKCEFSIRYCIYKLVGCEFVDENEKVKEHEDNNNKLHLDLAMKFIKDNNIINKILKFEIGEMCMTSCHPHPLKYLINRDAPWICDGDKLELGCDNVNNIISKEKPRYRCDICNFDLCDSCVKKYFKNSF